MVDKITLSLSPDQYAALPTCSVLDDGEKDLSQIIREKIHLKDNFEYEILKKSIDARRKDRIAIVFQIRIIAPSEPIASKPQNIVFPSHHSDGDLVPIVVGAGPAGLFAALFLARQGLNPLVIERGRAVCERVRDIDEHLNGGEFKPYSNIQFGEGGAGTFSDGKLYSGVKDRRKAEVLQTLVTFGAPEEILYLAQPHVGSDRLRSLIPKISSEIIRLGGKILFSRKLSDIMIENNQVVGIKHQNSIHLNDDKYILCNKLILAPGHSARDTFQMLDSKRVSISSKPFAVGVRIEHRQEWINKSQYGGMAGHCALPAATYKLAVHPEKTRALYSFCMCPGGYVTASASDFGQVVTNGMSMYKRNAINANAALLVPVDQNDFFDNHPLSGMSFQQELEKNAFILGGSNGYAPCQRVGDFLIGKTSVSCGEVVPSYLPGVKYSNLHDLFPDYIIQSLSQGIIEMEKRIKCFSHSDAILTAVETRSSSPIRILRDKFGESINTKGLFPCGEGAGYAGGIMSSAIDGLRIAEIVLEKRIK